MRWLFLLFAGQAFAGGLPVFDIAGQAAKMLSIAKQVEELTIIKQRIDNELAAFKRFSGKLGNISNIKDMINQINSFRAKARSIGYTYDGIAQQFEAIYGSKGSFKKNFQAWEKQSDDSVRDAMIAQGLLEKSKSHMADLDHIVNEKRLNQDQVATLQSIGEINAIQSKQLAHLSEIITTDSRAKTSIAMEERAKNNELKNYENHLMKDFNKHRASKPLSHFPSLGTKAR